MSDKQYKDAGKAIKKQRVALEKDKDELCALLEVGSRTYDMYESGDRKPKLPAIIKLAKELQIPNLVGLYGEQEDDISSEKEQNSTDDLKQIVMMMATNVNTLYATVKEDRESTKERFQVIDSNFAKLDSKVKSLSEFDRQTVHRLEQIEGRLAKLIMTDPNSGTAVLGKKRRN